MRWLLVCLLAASCSDAMAQADGTRIRLCDKANGARCATVDGAGAVAISGTINASSSCRATGVAPTYTEGTDNPISCDLAGTIRTTAGAGGGGGATFTNDGSTSQLGRVLDTDTGAGTHWTPEAILVTPGAGGPTQTGTSGSPLRIDPTGATTQPVSGTVTANQGGTWTVQPGNTANTTAWKVDGSAVTQPVSGTFFQATQPISGTVTANIGTSGSLALDASVTGLQVAQGSATAGQKGGLALGAVTTAAPTYTTAQSSPLSLTTAGGLRVDGSGATQPVSGTIAATQSGTWTVQPGNTANTTAWKVDGSAVTQPVSGTVTANAGTGTFTVGGTVTANQGTAAAASGAWPAKVTDGTNVAAVKAASTAAATTDPAAVVALSPNPAPQCTTVVAINQTASTQLVTGTASQKLYICAILIVSATAQNVSLVEGTGTVCATGIAGLIGGTTASVALAANGGWSQTTGLPFMKSKTAADNLCLLQSGAGNVSGIISYVSAP